MGYFLTARCTSCVFKHEGFRFGSGMLDHEPRLPALKKSTNTFIPEARPGDSSLFYYHEPEMNDGKPEGDGFQDLNVHLNPQHNFCPKCGKYTMEFVYVGNWD